MSPAFRLERGANLAAGEGVRFCVWAPRAKDVAVRVVAGGPSGETKLEPGPRGLFAATLPGLRAGADYLYRLDGRLERPDPVSRHQPAGVFGPSRVVDPDAFAWSDAGWRGLAAADLVFYELHVGSFTPAGTFEGIVDRLADLRELGVTALELMPVAEFPGARNWGYDGVFPYAPHGRYGGPRGLRRLVDAAHGAGLAVFLDVVYNHLGPEGNVLEDFAPYFTERYRTPWGAALNFDGPESDEVRRYFVDNALHWIAEYHLDGLRLDAVHAICDASPVPLLEELAGAVHGLGESLGRRVQVIAESDANDPRLVRPRERGGQGLDGVWSDDFHHAVHAALTGERHAYYEDFGRVADVAKALRDRFVYDGVYSEHRRRRQGAPAGDVPGDRFVVCVQNHDQVGNRAGGERLASLLPPEKQRLAAALLLLSPFVPLLFMGEEYGETAPFLYFVSHGDPQLLEAVREGRRREFEAFHAAGPAPDPGAEATFETSRPDPALARRPGHRELLALYRELLALRRSEPVLRPGVAAVDTAWDEAAGWIRLDYALAGAPRGFAVFRLGDASGPVPVPPGAGPWRRRFASEAAAFGGPGEPAPAVLDAASRSLPVGPRRALLYLGEAG